MTLDGSLLAYQDDTPLTAHTVPIAGYSNTGILELVINAWNLVSFERLVVRSPEIFTESIVNT